MPLTLQQTVPWDREQAPGDAALVTGEILQQGTTRGTAGACNPTITYPKSPGTGKGCKDMDPAQASRGKTGSSANTEAQM